MLKENGSKRCKHVEDKIFRNLKGLKKSKLFHEQVISWVFATGVTTHMLLVAGLKNPTVRKRYIAAKKLLSDFDHLEFSRYYWNYLDVPE